MKKILLNFMIIFFLVLFVGCPDDPGTKTDEVTVSSFTVSTLPTKKEYEKGTPLIPDGMRIHVTYSDGNKKYIVYADDAGITYSDITGFSEGEHPVTVKYKGKTATFNVKIYSPRPGKNAWETEIPVDYKINADFWDNATVYFVVTDRFYNGNTANDMSYGRTKGVMNQDPGKFYGGDIAGLTQKIDYLYDLGVNAIWLTAPYEQIHGWIVGAGNGFEHYPYHGYYALDFTNLDANMGTIEEFRTFVNTAHSKGIRVLLDVVINHPGYASLEDLKNLVPGVLKRNDIESAALTTYHDQFIDYKSSSWVNWWGTDWVRAGLPGYSTGSGDILGSLASLPDFKTEALPAAGLPVFFKAKYNDTANYPQAEYSIKEPEAIENYRVRDYLIDWVSSWVREFGIDGFRCDTVKHVENEAWYQLKVASIEALREWKSENVDKKVDDSDFWMTGEVWNQGVSKNAYFTEAGFNSLINFTFRSAVGQALADPSKIEATYSRYAGSINSDSDSDFNVLSYISSHDTGSQDSKGLFYSDYSRNNADSQKTAGTLLAMAPGAIQIYYGDEAGRKNADFSVEDKDQKNRSQMPWKESGYDNIGYTFDTDIHSHWAKVLNFRKKNNAVGGGEHKEIELDGAYAFSRVRGDNKVVVVIGADSAVTVDVTGIWDNGAELTDFYTGNKAVVADNKVTFTPHANGVVLIEK